MLSRNQDGTLHWLALWVAILWACLVLISLAQSNTDSETKRSVSVEPQVEIAQPK